jgi:L-asparaginase
VGVWNCFDIQYLYSYPVFDEVQEPLAQKSLVLLGTGGTIAGAAPDASQPQRYTAGQLPVHTLLANVPLPPGCSVVTEQLAQIDSKDMDLSVWQLLLRRCQHWLAQPQVQGLVITHGTDTLEETAWLLQALLAPARPLVLTGAMRPATAVDADGPGNLRDALQVAATPGATGVLVVCAGRILGAQDVQKVHSWRLDAYTSGDAGDIGRLRAGQVQCSRPWPQPATPAAGLLQRVLAASALPWVEIVFSHAAARGEAVDAWVEQGVQGVVVAGTGAGTVHQQLRAALQRAQARGVRVWRTTRCALGGVLPDVDDGLPTVDLPPVKARLALMLELLAA